MWNRFILCADNGIPFQADGRTIAAQFPPHALFGPVAIEPMQTAHSKTPKDITEAHAGIVMPEQNSDPRIGIRPILFHISI